MFRNPCNVKKKKEKKKNILQHWKEIVFQVDAGEVLVISDFGRFSGLWKMRNGSHNLEVPNTLHLYLYLFVEKENNDFSLTGTPWSIYYRIIIYYRGKSTTNVARLLSWVGQILVGTCSRYLILLICLGSFDTSNLLLKDQHSVQMYLPTWNKNSIIW